MSIEFHPVRTWLRYGVSGLYLGHANQSNDVFRYGTFFFTMAAEKGDVLTFRLNVFTTGESLFSDKA
jgi:hypothetical protein